MLGYLLLIAVLMMGRGALSEGPEVSLPQGHLRGRMEETFNGRDVFSFRGIPYARPPVNQYRFAEPVPGDPWLGTFQATSDPNECLQYSHVTYKTKFAVYGSEDCLYLNVFTPRLPSSNGSERLMDVLVFIHGGAFMFHGGYRGPRYLLDKDIVLVTINYRLGILGFLSTGDDVIPGNNGLKDQVLALKWIKSNIAYFGGDPDRVTLAGTSAGGASVHFHYMSKMSNGLFKSGISMSGTGLNCWVQADSGREKALRVGQISGCPINDTALMLECLRDRPATSIVKISPIFMPWLYNPFTPFGPVVEPPGENRFLSESPIELLKQGKVQNLPWLTSFTSHEGLYPGAEIIGSKDLLNDLQERWEEILPHLLDFNFTVQTEEEKFKISRIIKDHYLGGKKMTDSSFEIIKMIGDRLFVSDIVKAAKLQASVNKSPVYSYRFSYRGKTSFSEKLANNKKNYGASHTDDLGYILQKDDFKPEETESDAAVMRKMIDIFYSFISTGVPKADKENWDPVSLKKDEFAFKEIISGDRSPMMREENVGNGKFWADLGFQENSLSVKAEEFVNDEL